MKGVWERLAEHGQNSCFFVFNFAFGCTGYAFVFRVTEKRVNRVEAQSRGDKVVHARNFRRERGGRPKEPSMKVEIVDRRSPVWEGGGGEKRRGVGGRSFALSTGDLVSCKVPVRILPVELIFCSGKKEGGASLKFLLL